MVVDNSYQVTQAATGASAPSAATEGVDLNKATGFRVSLSAVTGQTLNGLQTLKAYCFNTKFERWCRNPELDLIRTITSVRDTTFPDLYCEVGTGRVFYLAADATISGGTNVVITIEVQRA